MINCAHCGKETNNKKFCSNECYTAHGRSVETRGKARKSMLGKKHSEEAKRKIGASHKGLHHTDETKQLLKTKLSGHKPWNTGKHLSNEHKQTLREANLGKKQSIEHKCKISTANKGRVAWNKGLTKENDSRMQKLSEASTGNQNAKGYKHTQEDYEKWLASNEGKFGWQTGLTKETDTRVANVAASHVGKKRSPETKEKMRQAALGNKRALGNKLTIEQGEKISKSQIGNKKAAGEHNMTPEGREKLRILNSKPHDESFKEFMRNKWDEPEYVRKQMKARNVKQNKAEKKLENILNSLYPAEFKFVGDGQTVILGKNPDFININGKKQIIELYGKFWHQNDNPEERELLFKQKGFKTLIIWDYELKKESVLATKIKDFVGV